MKRLLLAALISLAALDSASAQQSAGFQFNSATSLAVSSTTSNVALPGSGSKILLQNTGGATAYLNFGNSSVVATTAGMPLLGGECFYVQAPGTYSYIAGITSSSTTTVLMTQGEGNPPISCAPSITGGTGGTSSSFGAAFPAAGTAVGASQGGNMVALNALAGNLLVNCAVGCSGGTSSNASSGVATSSTNGQTLAFMYGWNGTTWDQVKTSSGNLAIVFASAQAVTQSGTWNIGTVTTLPAITFASPQAVTQSGAWTNTVTQATAASLNATVVGTGTFLVQAAQSGTWTITGAGGTFPITGATSNASSAVATSSTNVPTVAYTYGFNGTTWDQLQTDASKNLKISGGVAQGSTTSGQIGSPIMAAVLASAPTYTTATTNLLTLDTLGNLRVGIGPSSVASMGNAPVVSGAAEANHVLKAGAGNLYSFQVTSGASAGFVLVFDATSAPADGAVTPKKCYQLAANSTLGASWIPGPPLNFATGITVSFSTTGCFTKTASSTAFISGEIQ